MIKLMNNQREYKSSTFTHTATNAGTLYTFTHNFGSEPDLTIVQAYLNGVWISITDQYYVGIADVFGWQTDSSSTANTAIIRIARPTYSNNGQFDAIPSPCTLRVLCLNLGTTQTITNITPAFQWSNSEQVYPFEKDINGNILYCKYISAGAMPNSGWSSVSHGIPSWSPSKLHKMNIYCYSANDQGSPSHVPIPYNDGNGNAAGVMVYGTTNINIYSKTAYYSTYGYAGHIYIIYAK
jgi:hypothetical protein